MLALAACAAPTNGKAPLDNHVVSSSEIRIADLPVVPSTEARCNITNALRARFPEWTGVMCGAFDPHATAAQLQASGRCIADARRTRRPFVWFQVEEVPAVVLAAKAWIATADGEVYRADFMADPCGGTCPAKGGVELLHCNRFKLYCNDLTQCYGCDGQTVVADCRLGDAGSPK